MTLTGATGLTSKKMAKMSAILSKWLQVLPEAINRRELTLAVRASPSLERGGLTLDFDDDGFDLAGIQYRKWIVFADRSVV